MEAARVSQHTAYLQLKNSLATLQKTNKALMAENKELRQRSEKVNELQQQVTTLSHYEKRAKAAEARTTELQEALRKLRKEHEVLNAEKVKVELALERAQLRNMSKRRTTLHVPMVDNKVVDAVLKEDDDANTTFSCYEGAHTQLECVHLTFVHEGEFNFVRHRKRKRVLPSKCFEMKNGVKHTQMESFILQLTSCSRWRRRRSNRDRPRHFV